MEISEIQFEIKTKLVREMFGKIKKNPKCKKYRKITESKFKKKKAKI